MTQAAAAAIGMLSNPAERRKDLYSLMESVAHLTDEEIGQMALMTLSHDAVALSATANPLFAGACMRIALGALMREREVIRQRQNN